MALTLDQVRFLPKGSFLPDNCINNSAEHICGNPATLMAVIQSGNCSATIRCCMEEACKRHAAELAILCANTLGVQ